jgi:hypothetical protein
LDAFPKGGGFIPEAMWAGGAFFAPSVVQRKN